MTVKILLAMRECVERSVTGAIALRSLQREDPTDFLRASALVLYHEPDAPGQDQLLKLLSGADQVVEGMCDPDFMSLEHSVRLAGLLAPVDPQLDTKLARLLQRVHAKAPENSATMDRILAVLDAIPCSPRTVPILASLLRDPNPRLRAKLAKVVGRRVRNTQFAAEKQQESDPRVRANAIESLWGDKRFAASCVLWRAAHDENNRVVGNALLGLYQLQDREAFSSILGMSTDSRPQFRATAAWVMGQTGDQRFLRAVEKLAHDLYAPVRKNAAKALKQIRSAISV